MTDWWEVLQRAYRAKEERADALAALGKPVRFRDDRYGLTYLASVDTDPDGDGFRLTTFDARGPVGHFNCKSLRDAIFEALRGGAKEEQPCQKRT